MKPEDVKIETLDMLCDLGVDITENDVFTIFEKEIYDLESEDTITRKQAELRLAMFADVHNYYKHKMNGRIKEM